LPELTATCAKSLGPVLHPIGGELGASCPILTAAPAGVALAASVSVSAAREAASANLRERPLIEATLSRPKTTVNRRLTKELTPMSLTAPERETVITFSAAANLDRARRAA
jgi:hypothetical protein